MPLELYMLGLIVQDMPKALTFYRRLGLAVPEGSEQQSHVEIKMGPAVRPGLGPGAGGHWRSLPRGPRVLPERSGRPRG
jgi:hypothetical protein